MKDALILFLKTKIATNLNKSPQDILIDQNFMDLGLESNQMIGVSESLEKDLCIELYPTIFFENQNIQDLVTYFLQDHEKEIRLWYENSESFSSTTIPREKDSHNIISKNTINNGSDTNNIKAALILYLKTKIATTIHKSSDDVPIDKNFMDLGLESNQMIGMSESLEKDLEIELYPTVFFENQNIDDLANFFLQDYSKQMAKKFGDLSSYEENSNSNIQIATNSISTSSQLPKKETDTYSRFTPLQFGKHVSQIKDSEKKQFQEKSLTNVSKDIAIIGMSGYFPDSKNIEEFWKNISDGKDLIREIPIDHWDYRPWFNQDREADNKTYSKWGGFLPDIDKFDPVFFGVNRRQAEWMDPQLRLLLQSAYHTFEDAGVINKIRGTKTGVYVGSCFHEYWDEVVRARIPIVDYQHNSGAMSSLSASVSYHFDLQGGSIPLDNACASSMTALHLGCQAIHNGEIDSAVVAGLNVLLSPLHYVYFSRMQALSPTGRCHTFDKKADGYVPGEGIVSVLIKPLSKAEIDGDRIYGVIKGSAINHVGRSNNPTSPRPELQTKLLLQAWESANINPEDISYLEAHGTGTTLGDPIEINALKKAFKHHTNKRGFCYIGSTKAHAGHLEGAAGLTSVVKVLQMMKHNEIPHMPNFETINPYIKLDDSALKINTKNEPWKTDKPKIAGVSSFGMTGNNAHIVLEEYIERFKSPYISNAPVIIVLSARNKDRLKDQAINLSEYLELHPALDLYDIAYTLQVGRESMEERLAFVVSDKLELKDALSKFNLGNSTGFLQGNIKASKEVSVIEGVPVAEYLSTAIKNKDLLSIAQLWIRGVTIDWGLFYEKGHTPNRISLPTYPFARERYWIPDQSFDLSSRSKDVLHPLLHHNESTLEAQKYTSIYTGKESFLLDHKVGGAKVLPGVAYLELARIAGDLSIGSSVTQLKDITWMRPIWVNNSPEKISISIYPVEDGFGYDVYSNKSEEQLHSQGKLSIDSFSAVPAYNLPSLKSQFTKSKEKDWCYDFFKGIGLFYGTSFQGIEQLWYSDSAVLSRITLPKEEGYVLQPGILDSALQSCIGFTLGEEPPTDPPLPFSIKELTIYKNLPETVWCYVKRNNSGRTVDKVTRYDIDILDELGEVLVRFKDFVVLPLSNATKPPADTRKGVHFYSNIWSPSPAPLSDPSLGSQLILLAGAPVELADLLKEELAVDVSVLKGDSEASYFVSVLEEVRSKLKDNIQVHITVVYENAQYLDYSFVRGLLKTTNLENAKISGKVLGVESFSLTSLDTLLSILDKEQYTTDVEVRYIGGKREIRTLDLLPYSFGKESLTIKEGGVYLITGGFGGLGQVFASHINKTSGVHLILTGRSRLTDEKSFILSKFSNASYYCCDVSKKEEVASLISEIKTVHGRLDGIIHSAGVVRDSLIDKKTSEEVSTVFSSKVTGVKHLDELSKGESLDFMVFFSSIASVIGNIGQSDYSSANAYLDDYALYREEKRLQGERQGKTLSINWPLWAEGGMQIDQESAHFLENYWGMSVLPTLEGVKAFDALLGSSFVQGVVAFGDRDKINNKLLSKRSIAVSSTGDSIKETSELQEKVTTQILEIASSLLKLDVSNIGIDEELGDYGFDSILLTRFSNELNSYYDLELMPTTFYNYPTIEGLAIYLTKDYSEKLFKKHSVSLGKKDVPSLIVQQEQVRSFRENRSRFLGSKKDSRILTSQTTKKLSRGVAIVGMSGRFPGSPDVEIFWDHIKNNEDLITEIPSDRWDWRHYYGDPKEEKGKTKAKWGGFIRDIDKFDPLFFGISPREAELMDPQQRMILESVYQALEDACISTTQIKGSNTGVFVGVASSDYSLLLSDQTDLVSQAQYPTGSSHSVLVNRISYLLDLHGPSEPVDTACSSSLIAIHRAVEHIEQGHCDMAIAGGVNALLSPELTLSFSQAGMLSEDGRCKTFDQKANGYVRGEGVGTIILKSLDKAESDGDHIYGVIKGTAENHGGKANTLTSPNPNAQKDLLLKAYRSSGIDPRDVSYIEAHGTGTSLGDPIEIEGLKLAFNQLYKENDYDIPEIPYCSIGSVKTNIGHLEAAAGIAGVVKVLLSLKYKTLPGNVHLETPNEYLQLSKSPFYLQQETKAWESRDNKARVAGISSFGFGGANAHIIIEEYIPKPKSTYENNTAAIVLLSAKNKERLEYQANNLEDYIISNPGLDLYDIAYTLQVGRDFMEERVAFIVEDKEKLQEQLHRFKQGQTEGFLTGNIKKDKNNFLLEGEAGEAYIQTAISTQQTKALAQLWTKGVTIDWRLLYNKDNTPNKINLPKYPFARERYWFDSYNSVNLSKQKNKNTLITSDTDSIWESEQIQQNIDHVVGEEISTKILNEGIALVKIQSKESKNMFTLNLIKSLQKTFFDLRKNKNLKVVVLTGYDNIFCMGGSQESLQNIASKKGRFTDFPFLYKGLLEFDIPVITAMQGHAFGGGMLFGLYGDIVLMSENSIYTANFMKYGFTPGMGATYILGEKLGKPLATEMLYTARHLKGSEIKSRGTSIIVTKDVLNEALRIAKELSLKPRKTLEILKKHMSSDLLLSLQKYISEEEKMHELTFHTEEVASQIKRSFKRQEISDSLLSNGTLLEEKKSSGAKTKIRLNDVKDLIPQTPVPFIQTNRSTIKLKDLKRDLKTSNNYDVSANSSKYYIQKLKKLFETVLHIPANEIDEEIAFTELGLDSISGVELIRSINNTFNLNFEAIILYDYFTIKKLSDLILKEFDQQNDYLKKDSKILIKPTSDKIINEKSESGIDNDKNEKVTKLSRIVNHTKEIDQQKALLNVSTVTKKLKILFEEVLHIPNNEIDENVSFVDIGLDSINGVELIRLINDEFNINLEAITLYDYYTIKKLSNLILEESNELIQYVDNECLNEEGVMEQSDLKINLDEKSSFLISEEEDLTLVKLDSLQNVTKAEYADKGVDDIAIIGMSGKFPDAANINEFWENIKNGKNSIKEVPNRKWSIAHFFDKDRKVEGKSYAKWMGYLDDEDKFDPLFFNISPREAERMDPQQRLFIEESWKAIEDSGYTSTSLSDQKCGVFVGVGQGDYMINIEQEEMDNHTFTGTSSSILAGRISYHLNLDGPAISIDTACSSSLVAIHQACQSIRIGECETALAGGVYVMTSERMHIATSKSGMLSEDGKCHTFDNMANGFVPGEAVGVLLLKSLSKAEIDGDRIYGVIKGSAINQDGKTNGITAPNVNSQNLLQEEVYRKYNIDPSTITYVETHGTGTKLGDPIEIKALKRSFKSYTENENYCGIGSVKTNVGHTLTAAGVIGVIKVLLSIKNKQIPPTLNYQTLNEHINLAGSPFYVNTLLKEWKVDSNQSRKAAVSSFGFSGTNAHIVLEEYIERFKSPYISNAPVIIVLSARNKDRLKDQAINLSEYLELHPALDLYDIAYTLQVGRESMEERLAFVVSDKLELKDALSKFNLGNSTGFLQGNIKASKEVSVIEGVPVAEYLSTAIKNKDLLSIAQLWIRGVTIDWGLFYEKGHTPNRISLPTYPFARERYWIPDQSFDLSSRSKDVLHPLLHHNESTLEAQKYTSIYTGKESFLLDHKVGGAKVLPGVAYLELARIAGDLSIGSSVTQLKDITWMRPIWVNNSPEKISISIYPVEDGFGYDVYSNKSEEQLHSQGKLSIDSFSAVPAYNLPSLKSQFTKSKEKDWCYDFFKGIGLFYGTSFQGIEQLWYSDSAVLSRITLPKEEGYVLQPGILDSALQSCIGFTLGEEPPTDPPLPFSIKELTIYKNLPETVWCYVKRNNSGRTVDKVTRYDIDILDELGEVLVRFKDFVVLPLSNATKPPADTRKGVHFYSNIWSPSPAPLSDPSLGSQLILLAGAPVELADLLKEELAVDVSVLKGDSEASYFVSVLEEVRSKLKDNIQVHITVVYENAQYLDYSFVRGLLKTTNLENAKISGKVLGVESFSLTSLDTLLSILDKEQYTTDVEVRYIGGKREIRTLDLLPYSFGKESLTIKEGGVYLITGGFGGLGQVFASHINKTSGVHLILTGRSRLTDEKSFILSKFSNASYYCCDVSKKEEVASLISEIKTVHGRLDGIIHSAGVVRDSLIDKKTSEEVSTVFSSKVTGVKHLDELSKGESLDFMVFFSSIASVIGNIGQSDYSSANAYLDDYALYREEKRLQGERQGKTLSINWPLWAEGGMQIDQESAHFLENYWGMSVLPTLEGVKAFDALLGSSFVQGVVAFGDRDKINNKLLSKRSIAVSSTGDSIKETSELQEKVTTQILEIASSLLKLDVSNIGIDEELGDYGFDSILLTRFSNELNSYYDLELMPTTFYNYPTIEGLAIYLTKDYSEKLFKKHSVSLGKKDVPSLIVQQEQVRSFRENRSRFLGSKKDSRILTSQTTKKLSRGVAIVGMSGRFPGSPDVEIFWDHIKNNEDLITEIPSDRWDWRHYYGDPKEEKGKTKAKWGGFIRDIDKFDPLFFGISPREAELMDPQQRMILESVYQALEDACISTTQIKGSNTGVFVGVASSDYSLLLSDQTDLVSQAQYPTGSSHSVLVNRISYLLDLHGPSEPVDTACSSSLIAIHRAVEHIEQGHCDMAIAGGVNALLSPELTLSFSQAGMLSEDGRCKTFDQKANGYVRGEGVGTIILKSLDKAESDGDHIYGVIKGTAENHGGKANTLTSPNPNAQKDLLLKAYRSSGIDPRDVSYIEAHGTGTSLGDPIEIEGLKLAFNQLYKENDYDIPEIPYCSIGSVKTNIGHLEAAAGIAGVVKVLLSLKYKTLPGNVHLETPNEYLQLSKSPFYLQQETKAWESRDNKARVAGISSFGFGGANAHIIIEEYIPKPKSTYENNTAAIVLLSAKNKERLEYQANNLEDYIISNPGLDLYDIAYTLQVGRDFMEERVAFIVEDKEKLQEQLHRFKQGQTEGFLTGNIKKDKNNFLLEGEAGEAYIQTAISTQQTKALAQLWTKGVTIDWRLLYNKDNTPNKINLPKYPFARERYWLTPSHINISKNRLNILHPLIHINNSNAFSVSYSSMFTGQEFFFEDHKIYGEKLLPGVAYLEMARELGERALGQKITGISDLVWLAPMAIDQIKGEITTRLYLEDDHFKFEISSMGNVIHCNGVLSTLEVKEPERINIQQLFLECDEFISGEACDNLMIENGYGYGPSFQCSEKLNYGSSYSILSLNPAQFKEDIFHFHPAQFDTLLRAGIGFHLKRQEGIVLEIPFSLSDFKIYGNPKKIVYSVCWKHENNNASSSVQHYNFDLLGKNGELIATLRDFSAREATNLKDKQNILPVSDLVCLESIWNHKKALTIGNDTNKEILILPKCESELVSFFKSKFDGETVNLAPGIDSNSLFHNVFSRIKKLSKSRDNTTIYVLIERKDWRRFAFVSGIFKALSLDASFIKGKIISVDSLSILKSSELLSVLEQEKGNNDVEIRYINGKRTVRTFKQVDVSRKPNFNFNKPKTCIITGGMGSIGRTFAKYIAEYWGCKPLLIGRSSLSKEKLKDLETIKGASYFQCDISNRDSLKITLEKIRDTHNEINGIIHCAGVVGNLDITTKNEADIEEVLKPKLIGTNNLDEQTSSDKLQFFIMTSSISANLDGIAGIIGSDYAAANAYLDNFSEYRNELVRKETRKGFTRSIIYPYWEDGGMNIPDNAKEWMKNQFGLESISAKIGIDGFSTSIKHDSHQMMLLYGNKKKIIKSLFHNSIDNQEIKETQISDITSNKVLEYLKKSINEILKVPKDQIDVSTDFSDYGADSILAVELINFLEKDFGTLPKTLLFEFSNLHNLTNYFCENQASRVKEIFGGDDSASINIGNKNSNITSQILKNTNTSHLNAESTKSDCNDMAIVCVGGLFPKASNIDELWSNIVSGKPLNNGKKKEKNFWNSIDDKTILEYLSKLLISEKESNNLGRQERLICCVLGQAMNSVGLNPMSIRGSKTGVFLGLQQDFPDSTKDRLEENSIAYMIPNRLSFLLNLKGPSEMVNTYCSSIYVALHRAIQSVRNNECEQVLVGGVNVINPLYATYEIGNNSFDILSPTNETKSFCQEANGFVRSEGAGIMLIKPIEKAKKEGDKILGIIKGSYVHHGGKNLSFEAPNSKGIKETISRCISNTSINVDTIDYIEAHGIANRVADALELSVINSTYKQHSKDANKKWFIGTIKPTVGHSELVSGMASLIKVLKAFENKTIPGIPGLENVNSEIDQNHSLILSKDAVYWKNGTYPRRAALNSYAVGGVNAHLILEEYPTNSVDSENIEEKESSLLSNHSNESNPAEVITNSGFDKIDLDTIKSLYAIFEEVFEFSLSKLDLNTSLFDLNINSIEILQLVQSVNLKFGIRLKIGLIFQLETIDDFINLIIDHIKSKGNSISSLDKHVVCFKEGKKKTVAIIIPGMPGIVDGYYELAENVIEETVYGINMVGFDGEQPLTSIESIAEHYCDRIQEISTKNKITLYAHSFGGIVLFELLGLLKSKNIEVECIVLIDSYTNTLQMKSKEKIAFFIHLLCKQLQLAVEEKEIIEFCQKISKRPKKSRLNLIYNYLIEKEAKVNKKIFSLIYDLYTHSMNIKYNLSKKLQDNILLVKANTSFVEFDDHALGWSSYYKSVEVINSKGDHFNIIKKPFLNEWVSQLRK
ncbi:SDR family NAD(P)-dependent oxidoreductase [Aquimarina sp. RZ0]|uniref:SDR family NAD(P)-dependent oxidoreductase n=1 Tax=Aquimarina sp. RZ0 TaxID=2607730 RepID=UPI0011F1476D|nr:SDR family NAD(P)-dependent oxidoreductase [Aquimarina sp. RZ0]KAA1246068.1 SDR family NAD(P)-dependent oxidoreductase [Aquimarina sp. RZ0]